MDRHTLEASSITRSIVCKDCHTVWGKVTDPGHIDDRLGADVHFAPESRAALRAVDPFYDPETKTCQVACHGLNLLGGAESSPPWTRVTTPRASCTEVCHTLPPPSPHPQNVHLQDCYHCHPLTVSQDGTILKPNLHINGNIDVIPGNEICFSCHNQPPPHSPLGSDEERRNYIGAHQTHLVRQPLSSNVICSNCHTVPESVNDATHRDGDGRAEVVFDGLAIPTGLMPHYDYERQVCSSVYCHGATRSGGSLTTPKWSDRSGKADQCGSCHGAPPLPPHIQHLDRTDCHLCHTETAAPDGTIAKRNLHVNGSIEVLDDICVVCHGQPPASPEAPNHPHRIDCWTCHPDVRQGVPGERPIIIDHERHKNGTVDLFPAPQICTACHGQPPPPSPLGSDAERRNQIGAHQTHLVTQPLSTNVVCENCHKVPEEVLDAAHRDGDGRAEVTFGGLALARGVAPAYNPVTQSCMTYCHGASLAGGELTQPRWSDAGEEPCGNDASGAPSDCNSCHGVPPSPPHFPNLELTQCHRCHTETVTPDGTIARRDLHVNGRVDVLEDICVACHDQPPGPPEVPNHPRRTDCWTCHPTVGQGPQGGRPVILDLFAHNNGKVNFSDGPRICTACHGSERRGPAPPPDTEGNRERNNRAIGAHQEHLHSQKAIITCDNCHPSRTTVLDLGHRDGTRDILFGGVAVHEEGWANQRGILYEFDSINVSCTNYCHGATLPGGALTNPVWTDTSGDPKQCGSCHGFPPTQTGSHVPGDTECYNCHSSVDLQMCGSWEIVDPRRHINGVVDRD